jgi:glutamate-1-semialdehyde aminotransferase
MEAAQSTFISSTCWSERIGPAAALALIRKHKRLNAGDHLMEVGRQIQSGWRSLADKHNISIKTGGIPPLSHFIFESEEAQVMKALLVQLMLEKGFLASTSFYAMYAHNSEHIKQYLEALDGVFKILSEAEKNNTAKSLLKGKPAASGFKRLI